jgi:hypothetical protein
LDAAVSRSGVIKGCAWSHMRCLVTCHTIHLTIWHQARPQELQAIGASLAPQVPASQQRIQVKQWLRMHAIVVNDAPAACSSLHSNAALTQQQSGKHVRRHKPTLAWRQHSPRVRAAKLARAPMCSSAALSPCPRAAPCDTAFKKFFVSRVCCSYLAIMRSDRMHAAPTLLQARLFA